MQYAPLKRRSTSTRVHVAISYEALMFNRFDWLVWRKNNPDKFGINFDSEFESVIHE
jgi:hypothetical protein